MPGPGDLVSCSFCGTSKKQVAVIIGVPYTYICDRCVGHVHAVMDAPGRTVSTPIATILQVSDEVGAEQCCFCTKRRDQVAAMASAGDSRICDQCLELCDEILSEVPPVPSP